MWVLTHYRLQIKHNEPLKCKQSKKSIVFRQVNDTPYEAE
jgi:hypothetical protein